MATFGLPTMTNSPLISANSPCVHGIISSPSSSSIYPPLSAFPKHLPTIFVPADAPRTYGLASKASRSVRQEVKDFVTWSTTSVQLDRSVRYSASVQRTTTDKHETCLLAYLGFLVNIKGDITVDEASLSAYSSPNQFAGFIAFLQARDVGRGHVLKHVSLARKVNNYLISGSATTIDAIAHGANMDTWLSRLEQQLSASMPKEPKVFVPSLKNLYLWVDDLAEGAELMTSEDLARFGTLTYDSAWQNQAALIAALTVGRYQPPIRLSIERTLVHPSHLVVHGVDSSDEDDDRPPPSARRGKKSPFCLDADCRDSRCLGNHLEILGEKSGGEDRRSIRFIAPHHKTDRRGFAAIQIDLPEGIFTKLLLIHIDHGHKVLTQGTGEYMPYLFATRSGRPFSTANFTQYWKAIMKTAVGVPYFAPSLARTCFVDKYTDEFGEEPALWEGAATIMGNTVKMWNEQYNPLKRGREAQAAVDRHSAFADSVMRSS